MERINEITVKIRDVLIYFGVALTLTSLVKLIFGRKDMNIIGHASGLTVGWLVGKLIVELIDGGCDDEDDGVEWDAED